MVFVIQRKSLVLSPNERVSSSADTESIHVAADGYSEHIEFGAVCPECRHTQPPLTSVAAPYFEDKEILCRNDDCKRPIDLWAAILDFIGGEGIPTILLLSVGARETVFDITLKAGMTKEIDLTRHGIPVDASYRKPDSMIER